MLTIHEGQRVRLIAPAHWIAGCPKVGTLGTVQLTPIAIPPHLAAQGVTQEVMGFSLSVEWDGWTPRHGWKCGVGEGERADYLEAVS